MEVSIEIHIDQSVESGTLEGLDFNGTSISQSYSQGGGRRKILRTSTAKQCFPDITGLLRARTGVSCDCMNKKFHGLFFFSSQPTESLTDSWKCLSEGSATGTQVACQGPQMVKTDSHTPTSHQ